MTNITELAESLGRALGNTHEYRTMARAMEFADDDRQITELRNELKKTEESLQSAVRSGKEPEKADMEHYEATLGKLQASSVYQSLVAAQANLDKIMVRVDAAIQKGMREGAESRIILTT
jgi:cell fate (sporulation/competence/biofilm development) regulator YlbF (YheA/YmcA/DUF963 family)